MPNLRTDLTYRDMQELRAAYEGTELEMSEICDRWSFSHGALRQFAYRRGWKRPEDFYRCGVKNKQIPDARRETAKLLWESGESCARIARWIGVSENTAFGLCNREFGFRNLRINKQTFFLRRNLEILALYDLGTSVEDIADQFWLGSRTVKEIVTREKRKGSKALYTRISSKEFAMDTEYYSTCDKHERVLSAAISCVAQQQAVGGQYILWPTRGTEPMSGARGISMYLVHVEASYDLIKTGILFGRDRTTVAHACAVVEDKRDNTVFDNAMDELSNTFIKKACIAFNAGIS